jgi:predicted GNAT family acetyltransferase
MQVRRGHDPAAFLGAAEGLLVADEARNNLLLGLAGTLRDHPATYPAFDLWLVERGGTVVGAALQTPPHNLVLAEPSDGDVLGVLAEAILAAGVRLPGVSGARPEVSVFADRWVALAGGTWRSQVEMGVYALRSVRTTPTAPGSSRLATMDERDLVIGLVEAFTDEAADQMLRDPTATRKTIEGRLGSRPDEGGFWVWERDGGIVCLSGHGGPTPNGIRIGPVYTMPDHRGRGYATSLVAEQSAWLLAHGRSFCFLYTDLANPTSNAIYRRIGYEQICEAAYVVFDHPAEPRDQPQRAGTGV